MLHSSKNKYEIDILNLQSEKNDLVKTNTETVNMQRTQVVAAGEDWLSIEQAKVEHLIWIDGLQQEQAKHREEESEKAASAAKAREDEFKSMAKTISGFVSGPLEDLGGALVKGEAGWKDLAKSAVSSIAAVIRGLGEQAVIQSAVFFASGNVPGGVGMAAAAAGAFVAAGAVEASTASFAEGGTFTTKGPMSVNIGDNIGGEEEVTVKPVSSTGLNVDDSASEGSNDPKIIIAQFGNRSLTGVMQDIFDNQEVRIPHEIVV